MIKRAMRRGKTDDDATKEAEQRRERNEEQPWTVRGKEGLEKRGRRESKLEMRE